MELNKPKTVEIEISVLREISQDIKDSCDMLLEKYKMCPTKLAIVQWELDDFLKTIDNENNKQGLR